MNSKSNYLSKFKFILTFFIIFFLASCGSFKKVDTRENPINSKDRAKKNVAEGRGISVKNILGNGGTTYEFSTSNPLWRASLDVLDFLPLNTVDYSGGIIITDWYSEKFENDREAIKITLRFLSNEVRADSIKIVVHKRNCDPKGNCSINVINSKIQSELSSTIIKKAALLEKNSKKK